MSSSLSEDIALTNLMLARLRPVLGARAEAYLRWHVSGAFNGAGFDCGGGFADVSFFRDGPPETAAAVAQTYRIGCGHASVNTWQFDLPGVGEALAAAEQEFAALRTGAPDLLTQVARIQIWLIYRSTAAASAADRERLAAAIAAATGGTAAFAGTPYEFPVPSGDWNGDVEIVLPAPLAESALRARLGTLFDNLGEQGFYGFGAMCPNHDGTHCPDGSLRYAHITARQF